MSRKLLDYNPQLDVYDDGELARTGLDDPSGRATGLKPGLQLALAAQLLEVGNRDDLQQFLQSMIERVGASDKQVNNQGALVERLTQAAHLIIPQTTSLGARNRLQGHKKHNYVAAHILGLELEGLSPEDQEFELAKGFVRFAGEAIKNPATDPSAAIQQAAQRYAPGLLHALARSPKPQTMLPHQGQSGRWYRQDGRIIVELSA